MTEQNGNMQISDYLTTYAQSLYGALETVNSDDITVATSIIESAMVGGRKIFTCGNGGSAAIANHFACDHSKGVSTNTMIKPKLISLSSNMPIFSAIANDISYDDVFSQQIKLLGEVGDVLVVVSSSGNSKNIIKALQQAKEQTITTVAFTGFEGGKAKELADVCLYVNSNNYGIVEDTHHALMHCIAQFIRRKHLQVPVESVVF